MKSNKLIKLILQNFNLNKSYEFNDENETKEIQKLLVNQILSNDAFKAINFDQKPKAKYIQMRNIYPLTKKGIEQTEKNIYFRIRESSIVKIVSDIILLAAFILSIIYTLKQVGIIK